MLGKKRTSKTQKKRGCFRTRETQSKEKRTLQARENSFEYCYYVLSSEIRQKQLAETNERTLVMRSSYASCRSKRFDKKLILINSPEDYFGKRRRFFKVSSCKEKETGSLIIPFFLFFSYSFEEEYNSLLSQKSTHDIIS